MLSSTRRNQQERRASTREALLKAAVDTLVDNGLSRFSVASVASRANLSTGALFYNFPNRAALIAAMTRYLFETLEQEFVIGATEGLGDPVERAVALVDATWRLYNDPRMKAALELFASSRTDPELALHLASISAAQERWHLELAERLIGVSMDRRRLAALIKLVVFSIQGLVLDQLPGAARHQEEELLPLLREAAREAVVAAM